MSRPAVLILEDDPSAAEAFQLMLGCHGVEARVALDWESGWSELQRQRPEAILLDLHLAATNGMDFLRCLRTEPAFSSIPVAMITGDYLVDDRLSDELGALGARLHFKPLWEEDLVLIVRRLLAAADRAAMTSAGA
jgi:DNA-binding response OmpR family regulator